jgi:hypothetical protein
MTALGMQARFTKGQVNRAGVLLLDLRERMHQDGAELPLRSSMKGSWTRHGRL